MDEKTQHLARDNDGSSDVKADVAAEADAGDIKDSESDTLETKDAPPPPQREGATSPSEATTSTQDVLAGTQCLAGFGILFLTWGLTNSFGAFQTYYTTSLLSTHSASSISWIGTLQSSLILLGSVYAGPLYDWGYLRPLTFGGCFAVVLGMFMTSLCRGYWQFILAQGLLVGLGCGALFTPATAVVASWFGTKRRGVALGVVMTGSTVAGITIPILFNHLIPHIHFGWTTRVIAFILLALATIPIVGQRMKTKPTIVRRVFDPNAWTEAEFTLFAISLFFAFVGLYTPYFYIQLYCIEKDIITGKLNQYLLPIMNAAGFFGRLVWGFSADRLGPFNSYILSALACTILLFNWAALHSAASVVVFAVLYGFCSAGIITLPMAVVAQVLTKDMRQFGGRMTMQSVPAAIGLLIGNPIAGAVRDRGWVGLEAFSGAFVLAAMLAAMTARVWKRGWGVVWY